MAQYNEPITKEQLNNSLGSLNLSDNVLGKIDEYLADAGDNIQVATWNGTANDTPEGPANVLIFNAAPNANGEPTNVSIPGELLASTSTYIFDTDADISANFNTVDRVIVGGRGDNTFVVNGDHDTTIVGGNQTDKFTTTGGDDTFEVGTGETTIDAGEGFDNAVVQGSIDDYTVEIVDGALVLTSTASGNNTELTAKNVEIIEFSDNLGDLINHESIAVVDNADAGTVVRMYQSFLGRDAEAAGAKFWVQAEEAGFSLEAIAQDFLTSLEFRATVGSNSTNKQFVQQLYTQALGRADGGAADTDGVQYWLDALDAGASRAQVAVGIVGSADAVEASQDFIKIIDGGVA